MSWLICFAVPLARESWGKINQSLNQHPKDDGIQTKRHTKDDLQIRKRFRSGLEIGNVQEELERD